MSSSIQVVPLSARTARSRYDSGGRAMCSICNRTYSRWSHYQRHMQSHTSTQQHVCQKCSKAFFRIDSLRRHQSACYAKTVTLSLQSKTKASKRACTECALARVRCSHEAPCTRCLSKGLDCVYPHPRTSSAAVAPEAAFNSQHSSPNLPVDRLQDPTSPTDIQHGLPIHTLIVPSSSVETGQQYQPESAISEQYFSINENENENDLIDLTQGTQPSYINSLRPVLVSTDDPSWVSDTLKNASGPVPIQHPQGHWHFLSHIGQNFLAANSDQQSPIGTAYTGFLADGSATQTGNELINIPQATSPLNSVFSHAEHSSAEARTASSNEVHVTERYASGGGARDTYFTKLRNFHLSFPTFDRRQQHLQRQSLSFPDTHYDHLGSDAQEWNPVSDRLYGQISDLFQSLCLNGYPMFQKYDSSSFISQQLANACVVEYFENFHPSFPFQHKATFAQDSTDVLMLLATVAVGAFFVNCHQKTELLTALHEFLRRALFVHEETSRHQFDQRTRLSFIQASLLNVIGMYFADDGTLCLRSPKALDSLIALCLEHQVFSLYQKPSENQDLQHINRAEAWEEWRLEEETIRTAYAVWLFDSMLDYQQFRASSLRLGDIQLPLPSRDVLFDADSDEGWNQLRTDIIPYPSLFACLKELERNCRLMPNLTDFGHILVVHGLIRGEQQIRLDIAHVSHFCESGLSMIRSTRSSSQLIYSDLLAWPPWVKRRNENCDYFDALHVHANAVTGLSYGFERPVVLHLHLARVLLLSPYQEIQRMASFLAAEEAADSNPHSAKPLTTAQYTEALKTVRVWLTQDVYKMRLAVIHAGGIFWHIRRYSVQSFYEPSALFWAALVIWTYCLRTEFLKRLPTDPCVQPEISVVTPRIDPAEGDDNTLHDGMGDVLPIQIDHVLDDELVQTFVLGRERTQIHMKRVGDLDTRQAPGRLLTEANRLLQLRCASWPITMRYHTWLELLAKPSQHLSRQEG